MPGSVPVALGCVREHHAELTSTNDRALAWARAGAVHGACVTADQQTAGRGRLGRRWDSPSAGGLYLSIVLRPVGLYATNWSPDWAGLGLAVGLGVRAGLAAWVPQAKLKWPNDILVDGRKLGGVLCEMRWQGTVPDAVAGIGINVAQQTFASDLQATSLALALPGACPTVGEVLEAVLLGLAPVLDQFFTAGFRAIRPEYIAHSAVLGQRLTVAGRVVTAVGFDDDGALRVSADGHGPGWRVEAEDVWLLAQAPAPPY